MRLAREAPTPLRRVAVDDFCLTLKLLSLMLCACGEVVAFDGPPLPEKEAHRL